MNIFAIDDHELFLTGLKHLLGGIDNEVEYCGYVSVDEAEALDGVQDPDLILLDYFLPNTNGKDALLRVKRRFPTSVVVVLSSLDDPLLIREAINQGAAGFIPKSSSQSVLVNALKLILDGGVYLPRQAIYSQRTEFHLSGHDIAEENVADPLQHLTERQKDVIGCVVRGMSNKVIALEMDISEGTVKSHLSAAFKTLGVSSRTQAVILIARQYAVGLLGYGHQ